MPELLQLVGGRARPPAAGWELPGLSRPRQEMGDAGLGTGLSFQNRKQNGFPRARALRCLMWAHVTTEVGWDPHAGRAPPSPCLPLIWGWGGAGGATLSGPAPGLTEPCSVSPSPPTPQLSSSQTRRLQTGADAVASSGLQGHRDCCLQLPEQEELRPTLTLARAGEAFTTAVPCFTASVSNPRPAAGTTWNAAQRDSLDSLKTWSR